MTSIAGRTGDRAGGLHRIDSICIYIYICFCIGTLLVKSRHILGRMP